MIEFKNCDLDGRGRERDKEFPHNMMAAMTDICSLLQFLCSQSFYRQTFREVREQEHPKTHNNPCLQIKNTLPPQKPINLSTASQTITPPPLFVDKHPQSSTLPLSVFKRIIFPSILGKVQRWRGPETSIWYSASPRRGDEVDPGDLLNPMGRASRWVGDGEQKAARQSERPAYALECKCYVSRTCGCGICVREARRKRRNRENPSGKKKELIATHQTNPCGTAHPYHTNKLADNPTRNRVFSLTLSSGL